MVARSRDRGLRCNSTNISHERGHWIAEGVARPNTARMAFCCECHEADKVLTSVGSVGRESFVLQFTLRASEIEIVMIGQKAELAK